MSEILAADYYVNNARLMEAVAKLWIKDSDLVLDPTYGKGGFWKRYRPWTGNLIATDIDPEKSWSKYQFGHSFDFRKMPWPDGHFDVVVFDPAYVTPGGRDTSTIPEMNTAYGMNTAEATLDGQWQTIIDGMAECVRVLKPGGIFMQKCMNYISSGTYQNCHSDVLRHLDKMGLKQVDQFMLVKRSGGPQPKNRTRKCAQCKGTGGWLDESPEGWRVHAACDGTGRIATVQHHSRNNVSFLIVARKPK